MTRRATRLFLLLAIASLAACAPALREPRPVAELRGPAVPTATPAPEASAAELLARSRADFARRPDAAAVHAALDAALAAARADENGVDGLLAACRAAAWLIEHETNPATRAALIATSLDAAQWCGRRAPAAAGCDYALAIALGQQARERPATAEDGLQKMVAALRRAIDAAPELDEAGPHRVLALLLLRAPGWPAGPGDPDEGLTEAEKAATLRPDYPPNQLALGEALRTAGKDDQALAAYQRAQALAQARATAGDPDAAEWQHEAAAALARH
ncbi:MAG: hypothetical protein ACM3OB_10435 [Acidobacteriota bacterium]